MARRPLWRSVDKSKLELTFLPRARAFGRASFNCAASRHMHREAFRTWEKRKSRVGGGGGGGGGAESVNGGGSVAGGSSTDDEGGGKEAAADGVEVEADGAAGKGAALGDGEGGKAVSGAAASGDTAGDGVGSAAGSAAGAAGAGEGARGRARTAASMDDQKVHIFTSHFFTKLTEGGKIYNFEVSLLVPCVVRGSLRSTLRSLSASVLFAFLFFVRGVIGDGILSIV